MPVYASRLRVAVHQRPLSAFPFGVTLIHRDRCSDSSRRSTKNLRNRKIGANTFKFIILCISIYNHLNWCLRFKNTLPIRHWPYLILPSGPFFRLWSEHWWCSLPCWSLFGCRSPRRRFSSALLLHFQFLPAAFEGARSSTAGFSGPAF